MDSFSWLLVDLSSVCAGSVGSAAGRGEISLDFTDLARRGAGAGGGSFPAASVDVLSFSGCIKLLMKEARFASISFDSSVCGVAWSNVVPGAGEPFADAFLGGGGAGRLGFCCS